MINILNLKQYTFFLIGIFVPISAVLSGLFPFPFNQAAIFLWMIAFPLIVFSIQKLSYLLFMLIAICILIMQTHGVALEYPQKLFSLLVSLLTMIYVISSKCRLDSDAIYKLAIGLSYGAFFVNIITIYSMFLISSGAMDIKDFAEIFKIPDEFGLFRFALGNAIHVPFLMTICTIIGTMHIRSQLIIFLFICLNLITATIAQSRGVFLISLFHIAFLYPSLNSFFKIIIPAAFSITFIYFFEEISIVTDSLVARFSGDDYGSGDMRTQFVNVVLENFDGWIAIFGGGLLSSQQLILEAMGVLATIEASLLELSYELGILTTIIFLSPLFYRIMRVRLVRKIPIYFYLILGESFFLVPVSTMFGLTFTLSVLLLDCYLKDGDLKNMSTEILQET